MIIRNQKGWMKYLNSVVATIGQVTSDEFGGMFHTKHIAQMLEEEGATVTDDPMVLRIGGKLVISHKQIRAALNSQCKGKLERDSLDWYRVV